MASNIAAPKNTGGGGFVFEDDVCAWLLACTLTGKRLFGSAYGPPVRVDFQVRPDGWFLDDALVTIAEGTTCHRFALSIKSNVQFTAATAPKEFVACAWEQWLHVESEVFDRELDFMGLIAAPLSGAAKASVDGLVGKARVADPGLFPARLREPEWASDDERSLFAGFGCPTQLGAEHKTTEEDTARTGTGENALHCHHRVPVMRSAMKGSASKMIR
jgi:hypothetical protein